MQNFRCVACPAAREFPSFSTFREVCKHSLQVHRVSLETAVQSSTLLPDKLVMYLCRLCTPGHREIFLSEALVKKHLESHSCFFLKRWKEYTEIQCRICEGVIQINDLEQHVEKYHPVHMFADVNEVESVENKSSPVSSPTQDHHSSRRKSNSLSNNLSPGVKIMRSWLAPPTEKNLLWDNFFKPDQLISKYFSKLAPVKPNLEDSTSPDESVKYSTKTLIRVKPLSLLQAQAQPSSGEDQRSPRQSPVKLSRKSPRHPTSDDDCFSPRRPTIQAQGRKSKYPSPQPTSVDDCSSPHRSSKQSPGKQCQPLSGDVQRSLRRPTMSSRRSPSHSSTNCYSSPVPIPSSSHERELLPANILWSKKSQYDLNNNVTSRCLLCGLKMAQDMLSKHTASKHQDMMFECTVGSCLGRVGLGQCSFMFPGQLNRHHQNYHNLSRNYFLDTRKSVTRLPAGLVRISCTKCPYLVLYPDLSHMAEHLWSVHRLEDLSLLRYQCRICSGSFSSVEKAIEYSRDHHSDRSLLGLPDKICWSKYNATSSTERSRRYENDHWERRSHIGRRSRSPNSSRERKRSPSRKSRRSSSRKSRSSGSSSRKSRRSSRSFSRRSPSSRMRNILTKNPSQSNSPSSRSRSESRKGRKSGGMRSPSCSKLVERSSASSSS